MTANIVVWGLWLLAFLILEGIGISKKARWTSLSEFAWDVEKALPVTRFVLLIGLAILLSHIVDKWPG